MNFIHAQRMALGAKLTGKFALLALTAALAACGGGGSDGATGTPAGTAISVTEGQTYTASLPSRASNGNALTYSLKGTAPTGVSLTTTGLLTFNASAPEYVSLQTGQTKSVTVSYTVTNSNGATSDGSFSFVVVGQSLSNTAPATPITVARGATVSGSLPTTSTGGKALTYSLATGEPAPGLTFSTSGTYVFDASVAAYSTVAAGQTRDVVVAYNFSDGTDTSSGTLRFVVQGRDAVGSLSAMLTVAEGMVGSGAFPASSIDGKPLTYTVRTGVPGFALSANGAYTFDAKDATYKPLNDGQTRDVEAFIQATDGALVTAGSVKVTVTGKTDINTPLSQTVALNEGQSRNGQLAQKSALNENLIYTLKAGSVVPGFSLTESGIFNIDTSVNEYSVIATGQVRRYTAFYTVATSSGAMADGQINFDVTGVAGAPTGTTTITVEEGSTFTGAFPARSSAGRQLSYTVRGTSPDGFLLGADGAYTLDGRNVSYRNLNDGQTRTINVSLSVTEGTTQTELPVVLRILGKTNIQTGVLNAFTVNEGAMLRGFLPSRSADNLPLSYTLATGTFITGFNLSADGVYLFDTNLSDYSTLNDGQTRVVEAAYRVNDTAGNSADGLFRLTVNGRTNITATRPSDVAVTEGATASGMLTATANVSAPLTFTQTGTSIAGFTLQPNGAYTFNAGAAPYLTLSAGQTQKVTASYQITDSTGAFVSDTISFVISGVSAGPVAIPAQITASEGSVTSGQFPSTGANYVVSGAVPNGFTVSPAGAYSLDATTAYRALAEGQTFTQNVTVGYTVAGEQRTSVIAVQVTGQNTTPSANDYQDAFTALGGIRAGTLKFSANDPENQALTFSIDPNIPTNAYPPGFVLDPSGTYTVNTNAAQYNDPKNYGPYNLVYLVRDPGGLSVKAKLTITINAPAGASTTP